MSKIAEYATAFLLVLCLTILWYKLESNYDSEIGELQIWQKPEAEKGRWQKTIVIAWFAARNGYFNAAFDDGMDFVPEKVSTAKETREVIEWIQQEGYVRYSDADVERYRRSYGI